MKEKTELCAERDVMAIPFSSAEAPIFKTSKHQGKKKTKAESLGRENGSTRKDEPLQEREMAFLSTCFGNF